MSKHLTIHLCRYSGKIKELQSILSDAIYSNNVKPLNCVKTLLKHNIINILNENLKSNLFYDGSLM